VFLLWRSLSKQDNRKSILYDDQYDDIRENVVNHDEEGAGKLPIHHTSVIKNSQLIHE
jgi:hypothetical protein